MKNNNAVSGNKMLLRWGWREIWSGQLWPVMAALTLIIACVVALSALAIRVEKVMTNQGAFADCGGSGFQIRQSVT